MNKKQNYLGESGPALIFQMMDLIPASPYHRRRDATNYKEKVKILKVVGRAKSGRHYMVETNVGTLRKPAGSIPKRLLREFDDRG